MEFFNATYRAVDRPHWTLTVSQADGFWSYIVKCDGRRVDARGLLSAEELRAHLPSLKEALGPIEPISTQD